MKAEILEQNPIFVTMDVFKFLTSPFINKTEVAKTMWPDVKPSSVQARMWQKLNSYQGKRVFTVEDRKKIQEIWDQLKKDIDGEIEKL